MKDTKEKEKNKLPVLAGQSAGLLKGRVLPSDIDQQCVFSLFRNAQLFDKKHNDNTEFKEICLTFIQEKDFHRY